MIVVDANLLIYAVNTDAPAHRRALKWLEASLSGNETIGFSWTVVLAFLRLATRPGISPKPMPIEAAFDLMDVWLNQPPVVLIEPGPHHFQTLRKLLTPLGTAGNLTSDAHLAALAIEHGAELCSADSDFARFHGLRWRNPLVG